MFSKSFVATFALVATLASAVTAQLVTVDLPVNLDLGTDAVCPADAPVGTDINAAVLAVVSFDAVVTATQTVAGIGLVGAEIDLGINVCLCIDAAVGLAGIDLPANLDAVVDADVNDLVADGLGANVVIPVIGGSLANLLGSQLTNTAVTVTPTAVNPCDCPANATPICADARCSCICQTGFTYNPITNSCVLSASTLTRKVRRSLF